jgi:hypothetical protein
VDARVSTGPPSVRHQTLPTEVLEGARLPPEVVTPRLVKPSPTVEFFQRYEIQTQEALVQQQLGRVQPPGRFRQRGGETHLSASLPAESRRRLRPLHGRRPRLRKDQLPDQQEDLVEGDRSGVAAVEGERSEDREPPRQDPPGTQHGTDRSASSFPYHGTCHRGEGDKSGK